MYCSGQNERNIVFALERAENIFPVMISMKMKIRKTARLQNITRESNN
jgi:hypothetical protein